MQLTFPFTPYCPVLVMPSPPVTHTECSAGAKDTPLRGGTGGPCGGGASAGAGGGKAGPGSQGMPHPLAAIMQMTTFVLH